LDLFFVTVFAFRRLEAHVAVRNLRTIAGRFLGFMFMFVEGTEWKLRHSLM
jgi:hypothetical protein